MAELPPLAAASGNEFELPAFDQEAIATDQNPQPEKVVPAPQREANRRWTQDTRVQRPIPQGVKDNGRRYSLAARTQVLSYMAIGMPRKQIEELTGVPQGTHTHIMKKAVKRGFDPQRDKRVLDHYVLDGQRTGRPLKNKKANESSASEASGKGELPTTSDPPASLYKAKAVAQMLASGIQQPAIVPGLSAPGIGGYRLDNSTD